MNEKLVDAAIFLLTSALLCFTELTVAAGDHSDVHNLIGNLAIATEVLVLGASAKSLVSNNEVRKDLRKLSISGIITLGLLFAWFIKSDPNYIPNLRSSNYSPAGIQRFGKDFMSDAATYAIRGWHNIKTNPVYATSE